MTYNLTSEIKDQIIGNIKTESRPDNYYYVMVILSCIIATYGLLMNSVAVIIGAMLIAPLMFPIISVSVSISLTDNALLKRALWAEISGASLAIAFSVILTLLLPVFEINSEILARTKPTLLDLVVAFAAGLAGTIAICYRPSSAILPGIAIASALMPPLCVIGIGMAKQDFNIAGGALLLFLSNIIAINVASIIVFKWVGFGIDLLHPDIDNLKKEKFPMKFIYPFLLLIIVSVPLVLFMNQSINNTRKENLFSKSIKDAITLIEPHSELVFLNFEEKDSTYFVNAEIKSPQNILPEEVRKIENKLEYDLGNPVKINLKVIMVNNVTGTQTSEKNKLVDVSQTPIIKTVFESCYPEDIIEKAVVEKLSLFKDSKLVGFSYNYNSEKAIFNINIKIESSKELDSNFNDSIKKVLENNLKRKVILKLDQNILLQPSKL